MPYEIYMRETRRVMGRAIFTAHDARPGDGLKRAPVHADSIGVTDWFLDSHPCTPRKIEGGEWEGELLLNNITTPGQVSWRCLLVVAVAMAGCARQELVITSPDDAAHARIGVMTGSTGEAATLTDEERSIVRRLPVLVYDILRRYLEWTGLEVRLVSNITDIEDKIIERALREGRPWQDITTKCEAVWWQAMDAVDFQRPTDTPHATDYVDEMVAMIGELIERDHAYVTDDGVYMSVESVDDYGLLAHQSVDDMRSGGGDREVVGAAGKRHPADFALWKAAEPEHRPMYQARRLRASHNRLRPFSQTVLTSTRIRGRSSFLTTAQPCRCLGM